MRVPRLVVFALAIFVAGGVLRAQVAGFYPASKHGGNYMFNFYFPPAPSSTPWAPAWSPDGKWIAVGMGGSIWKVDPSTGAAAELTYDRTYHSSPDWSPDGKWIVYTAEDDARTIQLAVVNVQTGETHPLTTDEQIYVDPVFSPDGTSLAYVSTRPNGYFNVYIRPIRDGQWAGDEIAVTKDHSFGQDRWYYGEWDMHISPAWLPDGKELLLVSNQGVPSGSGHVVRVPAVADGLVKAQTVLTEQSIYRTRPHVSIDGKRFVFSSARGAADQFSNLYLQPTAGGEPYKLTFFEHDAFQPRWSPDGEWIAYVDNRDGLPQLALLETYGGENRIVKISERRWKRPMGILSVRTVDADTGEMVGSRIHLKAADGKFYAPPDAYARVSNAGDHIFQTTGAFRVEVPPGKVALTIVKGFEYWPETTDLEVGAGELATATIKLRRMTDMNAQGWYSGSTHVHMNYAGNLHNTLENLMMMSDAEDQDVVNELVANKDNRQLDQQFFKPGGRIDPVSTRDRLLMVSQEYRPPLWGHLFFLGLKDHLIMPSTSESTEIHSPYPSNTDFLRKAKAQGATVGYVHAFGGDRDPLETLKAYATELARGYRVGGSPRGANAAGFITDAALGTTDAIEWAGAGRATFVPWYAVLNNGIHVTATGGEDSISNLHRSKLIGSVRTYVYTGSRGLDMDAWLEGIRTGHAFVSTGPLVGLTVNGRLPGDEVKLPASGGTVEVAGRVQSITPLDKVVLVFNGQVVEEIPVPGDRHSLTFTRSLKATRSGWYHLRAEGKPADRFPIDTAWALGFTNPIWVTVGEQPVRDRASADYCLEWLDVVQKLADEWPGWRSQAEKDHVFAQFEAARKVYRQLASEGARSE